jgi:hypothetical protein
VGLVAADWSGVMNMIAVERLIVGMLVVIVTLIITTTYLLLKIYGG